ncbi:MAG: hypothetical protein L6R39_006374 [Caloplaca ligustica]|nr:MAG: hypothetical protein L6R39_006374 [Caloplaca ligustica]
MSGILDENQPPPSPPPAPPLPPQRYGNRAASALARFAQPFIYASRPPSAHGDRQPDSKASGAKSIIRRNSRTGMPINALDISPTRTHAVLAGREILKTIQVTDSTCTEAFNLRSTIIAYAAAHDSSGGTISARHKDQLAATDVKWSHGKFDTTIATAAANGQIVVYDINRPGVELARLHEHTRQVHRVAFNPFQGALLLSGSQDATIRLWDLRALARDESVMTCRSAYKYAGNSDGIRDLRWSPTAGVEFAVGTDNGVVQRWDIQKPNLPLLKVNAHDKTCYSIDWHPDGKHLASGGADKDVKIWDFSSTDRRMKVYWQMRAPKPIYNVRWRPPTWRSVEGTLGHWHTTQLATSYDEQDPRVHVWDLRRPSMPSRVLDRFDTAPSAMLWHSEDLLWSVNVAGIFTQTNLNFINRLSDKRSTNTVAIAPDGRLVSFLQKRSGQGVPIDGLSRRFARGHERVGSSGEKLSSSYSATDGSFEETSLLSSSSRTRRRKAPSTQSSASLGGTPPSAGTGGPVVHLDEALQNRNLYRPAQIAACGRISGVFEAEAFAFLAGHYQLNVRSESKPDESIIHSLPEALNRNADLAAYVGQYRLAQSWRILALALRKELEARADRNRARPLLRSSHRSTKEEKALSNGGLIHGKSTNYPVQALPKVEKDPTKRLGPTVSASGSNITTPLARPVPDAVITVTPLPKIDDSLELPEPAFKKQSPQKPVEMTSAISRLRSPTDDSDTDQSHSPKNPCLFNHPAHRPGPVQGSSAGGFHSTNQRMSERQAATENYRPIPRPVLRLEDSLSTAGNNPLVPRFERHDSNESFQMFPASTSSSDRPGFMAGSFGSSQPSESSDLASQQSYDARRPNAVYGSANPSLSNETRNWRPSNAALPSRPNDTFGRNLPLLAGGQPLERPSSSTRVINHEDISVYEQESGNAGGTNRQDDHAYDESDFLPSSDGSPQVPWTATAMLRPLIDYHLEQLSDVQLPAHLLLLLGDYIENNVPTALETSIFLTYHNQLVSLSLHSQAARLRKPSMQLQLQTDHITQANLLGVGAKVADMVVISAAYAYGGTTSKRVTGAALLLAVYTTAWLGPDEQQYSGGKLRTRRHQR